MPDRKPQQESADSITPVENIKSMDSKITIDSSQLAESSLVTADHNGDDDTNSNDSNNNSNNNNQELEEMLDNTNLSASASEFENSADSTLYITDLSPIMTEAHLYRFFTEYGPVKSIRVVKDNVSRRSLGYAFVRFTNSEDARKALGDTGPKFIDGRPIRVLPFEPDPSQRKYNHECNIFIKNVDPMITSESLYETFSAFGNIVSCKIATDDLGMSKGFAYILFASKDSADAAISKMNGVLMNDRKVYVDYHMPKWERINKLEKMKANFTNLYVKNIDFNVTEDELRHLFAQYGPITSLSLPMDSDKRCRGFGFVNYESHQDAAKAVEELNDYELQTKKLYVSRAQKKYEREEELRQQHEVLRMERFSKYQGTNLYVKFLGPQVTDEDLNNAFSEFGTITSAKVMTDDNGQSRGFGFVCFQNSDEAQRAISAMHEKVLWSNKLYVALALRKDYHKRGGNNNPAQPPPPPTSFMAHHDYSSWPLYSPMLRTGAPYVHPSAASQLGLSFPLPATTRAPGGSVVPTPPMYYAAAAAAVAAATSPSGPQFNTNRSPGQWTQNSFYGAPSQLQINANPKIRLNGVNGNPNNGTIPTNVTNSSPKSSQQRQFTNGKPNYRLNNNITGRPSSRSSQRQSKTQEAYGSSLLAAIASAANPEAEKQVIGEALYPKVFSHGSIKQDSEIAAKITGMLLEQDRDEVLKWFDDEPVLTRRIQQAYDAYSSYLEQQKQQDGK